jgi:hypothetical protein
MIYGEELFIYLFAFRGIPHRMPCSCVGGKIDMSWELKTALKIAWLKKE